MSSHNHHDILNSTNYSNSIAILVNFVIGKYLHDTILGMDGIAMRFVSYSLSITVPVVCLTKEKVTCAGAALVLLPNSN